MLRHIALCFLLFLAAVPPLAQAQSTPPASLALEALCLPQYDACGAQPAECGAVAPYGSTVTARVRLTRGGAPLAFETLRLEPHGRELLTDREGRARIAIEEASETPRIVHPVDGATLSVPLAWTDLTAGFAISSAVPSEDSVQLSLLARRTADGAAVPGARLTLALDDAELLDVPPTDADGVTTLTLDRASRTGWTATIADGLWCALPFHASGTTSVPWNELPPEPATPPTPALMLALAPPLAWGRADPTRVPAFVVHAMADTTITWRLDGGEPRTGPILVPSGIHEVEATAVENGTGRTAFARASVRVDASPPTATPSWDTAQDLPCSAIAFRVGDTGSGLALAEVAAYDHEAPVEASVQGDRLVVTLTSGEHDLRLRLRDIAGNAFERNDRITCDAAPPALRPGFDVSDWIRCEEAVWALGDDVEAQVSRVALRIDGAPGVSVPLPGALRAVLATGEHDVRIDATDASGHVASWEGRVRCDSEPPILRASWRGAVLDGFAAAPVRIDASATDEQSGLAEIRARVDGGVWQAPSAVVVDGEGEHVVEIEARDALGNVGHAALLVTLDTQAPRVGMPAAVERSFVLSVEEEGRLVEVSARVGEEVVGRAQRLGDDRYGILLAVDVAPGATVAIVATDAAGNAGIATATLLGEKIETAAAAPDEEPVQAASHSLRSIALSASAGGEPAVHVTGVATGFRAGRAVLQAADGSRQILGDVTFDGGTFRADGPADAGTYDVFLELETSEGAWVTHRAGQLVVEGADPLPAAARGTPAAPLLLGVLAAALAALVIARRRT